MHDTWRDLSAEFAAAILDPERQPPVGVRAPRSMQAGRRYSVYRNNVTLSLIGAMEANFPAVRRLAGDEFFAAMAKIFVRAHPPKSRLLAEYGDEFAIFLEQFEPLANYPYMPDVARLERLWLDCWHEADAPVLEGSALAAMDPERLFETRFVAHPASRLFASPHAAVSIMSANRGEGDVAQIDPGIAEFGLITRPHLEVNVRHISASTYAFLSALFDGASLGEALENALAQDPSFDVAVNLQGMLVAGVFTTADLSEN